YNTSNYYFLFYDWKLNEVQVFEKLKNQDKTLFETINFLVDNHITKIIVNNTKDFDNLESLRRNIVLPIEIQ
ncbi:MAG: hypothetical protein ACP5O4_08425, partial [bacterium]